MSRRIDQPTRDRSDGTVDGEAVLTEPRVKRSVARGFVAMACHAFDGAQRVNLMHLDQQAVASAAHTAGWTLTGAPSHGIPEP